MPERTAEGYDGAAPFPDAEPPAATTAGKVPVAVTAAIAGVPFAGSMSFQGGVIGRVATHRRQAAA